jgi:L-alanine-DL-glutamate epimerase-like enolase superfamily enzyme
MARKLTLEPCEWQLREPFVIARGRKDTQPTLLVTIEDEDGRSGRGEACGVDYEGETVATISDQVEALRSEIEAGRPVGRGASAPPARRRRAQCGRLRFVGPRRQAV